MQMSTATFPVHISDAALSSLAWQLCKLHQQRTAGTGNTSTEQGDISCLFSQNTLPVSLWFPSFILFHVLNGVIFVSADSNGARVIADVEELRTGESYEVETVSSFTFTVSKRSSSKNVDVWFKIHILSLSFSNK